MILFNIVILVMVKKSSMDYKDTIDLKKDTKLVCLVNHGQFGLQNIGNTCFMTSRIGAEFLAAEGENIRCCSSLSRCSSAAGARGSLSFCIKSPHWHNFPIS